MLCNGMLCYVMLCYGMLCYVMFVYTVSMYLCIYVSMYLFLQFFAYYVFGCFMIFRGAESYEQRRAIKPFGHRSTRILLLLLLGMSRIVKPGFCMRQAAGY